MSRQRIRRLARAIASTHGLPHDTLARIVKSPREFSTLYRAAALRNVVFHAPLSVTHGRPFAERRRLVREHYGI